MTGPSSNGLSRQYVKLCDVRDFDDPQLREMMRSIVPGRPPGEERERKLWEFGMLGLFLEEADRLNESTEVLAIGAGQEHVLFWLANRTGRVVATDIYGEGHFSDTTAPSSMLSDPKAFAPYEYRDDRLEVRHMDARDLDFPDESFDVAFSMSSIEHFGSPAEIAQSAREMGRVLRPGGHAIVATECFVDRHPLNSPLLQTAIRAATLGRRCPTATPRRRGLEVFTAGELQSRIVRPSGLRLLQEPDLDLSPESRDNVATWDGTSSLPAPATGEWFPHVLLHAGHGAPWTSVCLVMQKPAAPVAD
jgi:SAM-dependent methyltransferase